MTQRSRAALKAFFETGDKPTAQQFADLIDSLLNLVDDGTPYSSAYTSYVAFITQTGATAPVLTEVFNNTGLTFEASRNTGGNYSIVSTPAFDFDYTVVNLHSSRATFNTSISGDSTFAGTIQFYTYAFDQDSNQWVQTDNVIPSDSAWIEVRCFNPPA